ADLSRFHKAQEGVYEHALTELRAGRKESHWIWFILPQLASLGHSPRAKFYGIADLAEARAYAADPLLGPRLAACADALLQHDDSAEAMLGPTDAMKLRSCATLFAAAAEEDLQRHMQALLDRFFGGKPCPLT
ncbi:DUF1810 domain-containing protein, partial [Thioclava sp. BHET1]